MSKYFHNHCDCNCHKPQYIVLFCGDDSNFVGNQTIFIELETDIDTTGCKAHLKYISKTFTWNAIPEDKRLELVFSAEETKAMPLGDWDAELWLEDAQGRRRTVSNQIRIRVTKSVGDAYWSGDPQSIKASIGNAFDYNNAYNKPTLNGVVIEGNKTSEDYHIKGGGGGTGNYNDLENKPKINGVELSGNKSSSNLRLQEELPVNIDGVYLITTVLAQDATRANSAEKAQSAMSAEFAERAGEDGQGRGISDTYATKEDTYNKSEVDGKLANMVSKDDVVPVGDGTETIATIGGKDIKVPAVPVSSVNDKTGAVKLVAADVGALPIAGGTLTGDLAIGDKEHPASRKLTVEADGGANGIQLTGGNVSLGSSITIGGSSGPGGTLVVEDGGSGNASIKKGGKEVATEEQLTPISAQSAYPMATVVGGALKDRTVNHATAGGTFTFPARTGTNARDFVLVIDALETAPTVTFPGSFTYVSEQDAADIWAAEAGKVNAWYFSEVADGVFMVCHKAMSAVAQEA